MKLSHELKSIPNMLSILRLLLVPVFLLLLVNDRFLWALAVLAFASFTDWLDGQIARRFNQVTQLGKLLDPSADRLFILATLIGLTWHGIIPSWFALVIVMRDILLLVGLPVLRRLGYKSLPVHFVGKAGTFALMYALPLLLMADVWVEASWLIQPIAWAFAWWGIALYWLSGFIYLAQLRNLVSRERQKSSNI
jgi:cardiolipin synthase